MNTNPDDRYLTVKQAAQVAQVSRACIDDALEDKELPAIRLGPRTTRIRESELHKWLASKRDA